MRLFREIVIEVSIWDRPAMNLPSVENTNMVILHHVLKTSINS